MAASFKLNNGFLLLSTEAPGGIYNATQLKKIATLCDGESAIVKATEDQRLAILVHPDKAQQTATELKSVGLGIRNYQEGLHQPINCVGALCPEHTQDAMTSAMDMTRELAKVTLGTSLRIGINGCGRCCVPTHTLDISVVGDAGGYRISLGGKNSQIPEMATFMAEGVPAAKLPKLIAKVINIYKELVQPGESLQDVIERAGSQRFVEALAPYSQDAHQDDPFASLNDSAAQDATASDPSVGDDMSASDADAAPGITDDFDASMLGEDKDLGIAESEDLATADLELESELATDALETSTADDAAALPDLDALSDLDSNLTDNLDDGLDSNLDSSSVDASTADLDTMEAPVDDLAGLENDSLEADVLAGESVEANALEMSAEDDLTQEITLDDIPLNKKPSAPATLSVVESTADDLVDLEMSSEDDALADDLGADVAALEAGTEDLSDLDLDLENMEEDGVAATSSTPKAAPALTVVQAASSASDGLEDDDPANIAEVGEAEADAFEEKLNASIEDESTIPAEDDTNVSERMEAMRLVEAAEASEPVDTAAHNFDDLEIDTDLDDLELADDAELTGASELDVGAEDLGAVALDDIDLEPEVLTDEDIVDAPATAPANKKAAAAPSHAAAKPASVNPASMDFAGMDFAAGGRVSLRFTNGASITLDPRMVPAGSSRELQMAGKRIVITHADQGLNVEVDGLGIYVPLQAA